MRPDSEINIGVCSRSFSANSKLRGLLQSRFKNVKFNDSGDVLSDASLIKFLSDCTHAIVALEVIDWSIIKELPRLKRISKYGVGLDNIDIDALNLAGIELGWTPGVNARSVAELIITFALMLRRNIVESQSAVINKEWRQVSGHLLSGCTFGVVGCGHVGSTLLKLLEPFNCRLVYHDILPLPEIGRRLNAEQVDLPMLLKQSDIVSVSVPFSAETYDLIGASEIAMMQRHALLINTARGGIVNEEALKAALIKQEIGGAGFDVFRKEPFFDRELLGLKTFIATPHIGGSSIAAIEAMGMAAIEGLVDNERRP